MFVMLGVLINFEVVVIIVVYGVIVVMIVIVFVWCLCVYFDCVIEVG